MFAKKWSWVIVLLTFMAFAVGCGCDCGDNDTTPIDEEEQTDIIADEGATDSPASTHPPERYTAQEAVALALPVARAWASDVFLVYFASGHERRQENFPGFVAEGLGRDGRGARWTMRFYSISHGEDRIVTVDGLSGETEVELHHSKNPIRGKNSLGHFLDTPELITFAEAAVGQELIEAWERYPEVSVDLVIQRTSPHYVGAGLHYRSEIQSLCMISLNATTGEVHYIRWGAARR